MYETIFHLKARPFTSTPFVQNYFAAESIHHALAQARSCIERASGPLIVTGTPGTGKSLLLGMLAQQFGAEFRIVSLICGRLSEPKDLLQNILFELDLPYRDLSEGELRLSLIDYLKSNETASKGVLLLVDEAHGLTVDLLDELRMITNFVRDDRPRVSLVMAGSPTLEDHLIDTKSESFNQRIAARCYLTNLTQKETIEYILTHIERVGGNGEEMFTGEALKVIHQASEGCPRVINQICDYALVLAANMATPRITSEIVREAWNDVQSIPGSLPSECSSGYSNNDGDETTAVDGDEDMMVIEFGQLESDDSYQTTEDSDHQLEVEYVEFGPMDNDEEIQLSETEQLDFADAEALPATDTMPEARADLADLDYAVLADGNDIERPQNFSNPFEEEFHEEEMVDATFHPAVAEQNLSSLTLMPDQLGFLDEMPAHTNEMISYADAATVAPNIVQTEPAEAEPAEAEPLATEPLATEPLATEPLATEPQIASVPNNVTDNTELKLSDSGLSDLDRIEDDVRRLQREFSATGIEETFSAGPTLVSKSADQPIEELMQQHPVRDENSGLPDPTVGYQVQVNDLPNLVTEMTDDRDMMIIDGLDHQHDAGRQPIDQNHQADSNASTGYATRMDYQDLFRQLRNSD